MGDASSGSAARLFQSELRGSPAGINPHEEAMKIVKFTAENMKRLKVAEIDPKGNIVEISGANGAGKSSVLDAIFWTLAGNKIVQKQPIRHGASEGRTELDLGDLLVKKKFSKTGATVVVERKVDGVRIEKPQAFLDNLCGKGIGFDPLGFSRMKPKEQFEQLRRLVKIDVDVDELDRINKSDFDKRTEMNREIKSLGGQADGIVVPANTPDAGIDVSELTGQVETAATHNKERELEAQRRDTQKKQIEAMKLTAGQSREKAKQLRAEADKMDADAVSREKNATDLQNELDRKQPIPDAIDVSQVRQKITEAVAVNAAITKKASKAELLKKIAAMTASAQALTDSIEAREKTKRDAIAAAKFPVEGLGFGADEVLLGGVPFEQASSAEQLRASCAIAMAMSPELRLIIIRDGSLLDERSMAILGDLAKGNDYQVWMEVVDTSGTVGVVLEDGMVVADNQKSDEQPA